MMYPELDIPPPKITDSVYRKPLLCGPGPCDVWPSVLKVLQNPVIAPMTDQYCKVIDDIRAGLKYVFQTKAKLVLAISGAGHSGMETVISNLVGPGEKLLIASRGIWDERAYCMAKRYGIDTIVTEVPQHGATFSMDHLNKALKEVQPKALFITCGDSSTGTIQDISRLGDLCHKYGALLIVDAVVSLIGVPFFMDAWGVDAVYTSTQKAFSGPAGISPVAFSSRAEAIIESRKHEPPFYFDVKLLALQWNCYGDTRAYHHTLSPPLLYALRECLKEIINETLPVSWARHRRVTEYFHAKLKELPVQFFAPLPSNRLITVTTLTFPEEYDSKKFITYMREKYNILMNLGLGPTAEKAVRIGIMGVNSNNEVVDQVVQAMAGTFLALSPNRKYESY